MRPFGRQGALCAPGRGLPRGSVKGPAGHVARDRWSLRPPGKQFRRWAAPVRQRRAACAWPNLSAENLSPRVVRPVGRGAHPSEDTVAMAEAAPARVSAPAGGRRVRGSRHSRPRAPPPYPTRPPQPAGVMEIPARWTPRPRACTQRRAAQTPGPVGCALRPVTATWPPGTRLGRAVRRLLKDSKNPADDTAESPCPLFILRPSAEEGPVWPTHRIRKAEVAEGQADRG